MTFLASSPDQITKKTIVGDCNKKKPLHLNNIAVLVAVNIGPSTRVYLIFVPVSKLVG
jgi:hypothetical protein